MKKNLPTILISFFTVVLIGGIVLLAARQPSATASSIGVGSQEINFTLKDTDNNPVTLASFKDKNPVLLEFFAVWCPHCQRMTSVLEDINNNYAQKGLEILSVQASQYGPNYESGDSTLATLQDLQNFKSNFHVSYPVLQDFNLTYATKYNVQGFPTFYVIDKTGKITYTSSGEQTESTLTDAIKKVL